MSAENQKRPLPPVNDPPVKRKQQEECLKVIKDKSGVPCEWFTNGTVLEQMGMTCAICMHVIQDPWVTSCSHSFCTYCIKKNNVVNSACPVCRSPRTAKNVTASKMLNQIMGTQTIRCPISSDCPWTGTLEGLPSHECDYMLVKCDGCAEDVERRLLEAHGDQQCTNRFIACELCQLKYRISDTSVHSALCPKVQVKCADCGLEMDREAHADHLDVCPKVVTECPFGPCTWIGARELIEDHVRENIGEHVAHHQHATRSAALDIQRLTDISDHFSVLNTVILAMDRFELVRDAIISNNVCALRTFRYMGIDVVKATGDPVLYAIQCGSLQTVRYYLEELKVRPLRVSIPYRCDRDMRDLLAKHGLVIVRNDSDSDSESGSDDDDDE